MNALPITKADLLNERGFECIREVDSENGSKYGVYFLQNNGESSISLDSPIFKYTQLPYIDSWIEKNHYSISNRALFSDYRERGGVGSINEIVCKFHAISEDRAYYNQRLNKTSGMEWQQHISCWTFNPTEDSNNEDFLLWKSYTQNAGIFACRIQTTIRDLVNGLIKIPADLFIAPVSYRNPESFHIVSFSDRLFSKSHFYKSENEIRFVFLTNDKAPRIKIEIDRNCIQEIRLSPFSSKEDISLLNDFLTYKFPFLKNIITTSKIIER